MRVEIVNFRTTKGNSDSTGSGLVDSIPNASEIMNIMKT